MEMHIFETYQALLSAMATYFVDTAQRAIDVKGAFNVALAGGNSPKKLYELLASEPFKHQIDWNKVYFFFGDERYVAESDSQRNSGMVYKALFEPLKIHEMQIFTIDATLLPDDAAQIYDNTIKTHFENQPVQFDLMLLGLGDNAHTASLFPSTPVLTEIEATVKAVTLEDMNSTRITMTAPLINQSKKIAFLVYGADKAEAVHHVLKGAKDFEKYPAQLITEGAAEIHWFLDNAAAKLLNN